jgi:mycoredoxin
MKNKSKIKVYGTTWCGNTRAAVLMLNDRNIPYDFIDIDQDAKAEAFVRKINDGYRSVPTIVFPDESILVEPSGQELVRKLNSF